MASLYVIREHRPGMWAVYDIATGAVVVRGDEALCDMDLERAAKVAVEMNKANPQRRDALEEPGSW